MVASADVIQSEALAFVATPAKSPVSALLMRPQEARWLLVFGHGAGAGMRHRFMEAMSARLFAAGIATFRYQFAYMEAGSRRPDPRPTLLATVRAAVDAAQRAAPDLPLLAGGKSMGGRMSSLAAAEAPLPGVRGLVFFGFPLHPAGRPSTERADHLEQVDVPMLFLQGERDQLAGSSAASHLRRARRPRHPARHTDRRSRFSCAQKLGPQRRRGSGRARAHCRRLGCAAGLTS